MRNFAIDFVRQIIEQTLLQQKILNPSKYFGGENEVNLFSFYEQLQKEDAVNRYVEIYRDLTEQQNRTGLIMNGTIIAPENPTITNISQCLIVPMTFTCSFRVTLADRDKAIETINNLIDCLKGRKRDIACFKNGELFMVGTIANEVDYAPKLANGDYIGKKATTGESLIAFVDGKISALALKGVTNQTLYPQWYYFQNANNGIAVAYKGSADDTWKIITDSGAYPDIIFPPTERYFDKYKVSLSFDSIRCDEPRTLNAEEYCIISFGGSATLVNESVKLGNDLTKLSIQKHKLKGETDLTIDGVTYWLEPLELPSGNSAETQLSKLMSNKFVTNGHTDSINLSIQYSFLLDESIDLLEQLFDYARYGAQGIATDVYASGISPNIIYKVTEYWSSWGNVKNKVFKAKIIETINIENTESDVLSIVLPMQIQGDND